MGDLRDYHVIGGCMGLNGEQVPWCQIHLQPGMFCCQLGEGPWRRPFIFRVPQLRLESGDESDEVGVGSLAALPVHAATEFASWGRVLEFTTDVPAALEIESSAVLDDAQRRYLASVIAAPGNASASYSRNAGVGAAKAKAVRDQLVALGYLITRKLATGKRGREAIVVEPTRKGLALLPETKSSDGEVA
jgi:hypothetical protein